MPPTTRSARSDLIVVALIGAAIAVWLGVRRLGLPATVALVVAALVVVSTAAAAVARRRPKRRDARHDHGLSRAQLSREVGELGVRERGRHARPSLSGLRLPPASHVGLLLGTAGRTAVWASVEDSILVVGPPRSGKTASVVVPLSISAPGPIVATSTRPEVARLAAPRRSGAQWGFAPASLDAPPDGRIEPLRWHPARGCEDPMIAVTRAQALVAAGSGLGGSVSNADFWAGSAASILRCYLHAAALDGRPATDILAWSASPRHPTPIAILERAPGAAPGWADELRAASSDPRLAANVWAGVQRSLDSLRIPAVAEACSPTEAAAWTPDDLLDEPGAALYLWGDASSQMSVAPLIAALVQDVVDSARRRAAVSTGGRLDPPLSLVLDEAANIAPLPELPVILSDGGGSGITTVVILQSLAQARGRWGEARSNAMWDAATLKLVLPGLAHASDLEAISRLIGEVEVATRSHSRSDGGTSETEASTWRPRWSPDEIRRLPHGRALLLSRRAPALELVLRPHWER